MISIVGPINSGAAVGADGAATANSTTTKPVNGRIAAVYVKYNDAPPAGTTIATIATSGGAAPANAFLTITNAATSGWFYPRVTPHGITGSALAALTVLEPAPIYDTVKVTIAGANAADNLDIWLLVEN
jgi:hypothetical protein